jgi:hypothetical protein
LIDQSVWAESMQAEESNREDLALVSANWMKVSEFVRDLEK